MFNDKSIMITGGTGSFGRMCTSMLLQNYSPRRLIIFSRDEMKQWEMQHDFPMTKHSCLRYFVGDVRDRDRLYRAMRDVDYVIHAAALKIVPTAEYNPFETIRTNISGTENVISAAIDCGVKKAMMLSTDKAVSPANLYGATKLCAEKMFVAGNSYSGNDGTRFGVVRYGNVVGSRGSVVPLFMKQRKAGRFTVTDERMTRFWITLRQGIKFVLTSLEMLTAGEVFVPKLPTMRIIDLARALCPECDIELIGIRPGEKLHELMISADEARNALELNDRYIIKPAVQYRGDVVRNLNGRPVAEGFEYSSGTNPWLLSEVELFRMLGELYPEWRGEAQAATV